MQQNYIYGYFSDTKTLKTQQNKCTKSDESYFLSNRFATFTVSFVIFNPQSKENGITFSVVKICSNV